MSKPKMFNPAAFGGGAAQAKPEAKEADKKPYECTGVSARDQVRKILFETFSGEGHSEIESAKVSVQIESAIAAVITDPKSRQYRDKARQIQLKLKGQRAASSRQQLLEGSLTPETVCTDEFLKASAAGPSRPGSRPQVRPRAAAPGQPVRPRGGPPGMVRPAGFRPVGPRAVTPIRAPGLASQPRPVQQAQPMAPAVETTNEPQPAEESKSIMPSEQSVNEAGDRDGDQSQTSLAQQKSLGVDNHDSPETHHRPIGAVDISQNVSHISLTQEPLNEIAEQASESSNVSAPTQQDQQPSVAESESSQRASAPPMRSTDLVIESEPSELMENRPHHAQAQAQAQEDAPSGSAQAAKESETDQDSMSVRIEASLDTTTEQADVSSVSGVSAGKKKAKKVKKKKKAKKVVEPLPLQHEEIQEEVEQTTNLVSEPICDVQPSEQVVQSVESPAKVSPRMKPQTLEKSIVPQVVEEPEEQAQPAFVIKTQPPVHRSPVREPETVAIVEEVKVQQTVQRPPSAQLSDAEPCMEDEQRQIVSPSNRLGFGDPESAPIQAPEEIRQSPQFPIEQDSPTLMPQRPEPVRVDYQPTNSSGGGKMTDLLMAEVKQLREDARRARQERNLLQQALDQSQRQADASKQVLQADLKQREAQVQQMRKELMQALDEADQYKQRLQKAHIDSQRFRETMEDQMRNAMQRMQSLTSTQSSIQGTGLMVPSSSQGTQGTSPNASSDSEVQRELQALRQQCQSYEMQLQEKNHELQMRVKELQRVERQNITLSEQNKKLSDSLGELQNQNLSTIAGSGSLYSASQHHLANQSSQMAQFHQNSGVPHQTTSQASRHHNVGQMLGSVGISGGLNPSAGLNGAAGSNGLQSAASAGVNHTAMGLSSGGLNLLMNMGDSGDADDGGREGEARYFNDVTQDEGTGGDTYTREQVVLSHYHHAHGHVHPHPHEQHEAIPQSSSGISGSGAQYLHHHSQHSGAIHHAYPSQGVSASLQSSGGGVGATNLPGGTQSNVRQYLVGTASAGGDYIDGSYGQLPEGHEDNSDEDDSEPENHREQDYNEGQQEDCEEEGHDYEFIGVGNQALPSQAEMDMGGVHNETDHDGEDEDEEGNAAASQPATTFNVNNISLIPSSALANQANQSSQMAADYAHQHHRTNMLEDENGHVEDGSRGEEGGCREYNYMDEEIELNSGNHGLSHSHHQSQDAPELGVHPQNSGVAKQSSPQNQPASQQLSDNGSSNYQASAGGVVETGRRNPQGSLGAGPKPAQGLNSQSQGNNQQHSSSAATGHHSKRASGQSLNGAGSNSGQAISLVASSSAPTGAAQQQQNLIRGSSVAGPAYEEEEGGEDTYDQVHHGGIEPSQQESNSSKRRAQADEEEKGDGSLRAPSSNVNQNHLMMGLEEDHHGSSGNNQQNLSMLMARGNLQSASLLGGVNGGVSLQSNSGQSSAIQGQTQSAGGPNTAPNGSSQHPHMKQGNKGGKIKLGIGAAAAQQKMPHHYFGSGGQSTTSSLPQQNSSQAEGLQSIQVPGSNGNASAATQAPATMPYPQTASKSGPAAAHVGQNNANPDESSNGGASVSCQPQTNAVVAANAASKSQQQQQQLGATQSRVAPSANAVTGQANSSGNQASQMANNAQSSGSMNAVAGGGTSAPAAGTSNQSLSPDSASRSQVMGMHQMQAQSQQRNPRRGNKQQLQQHNATNKPRQGGGSTVQSNSGRHQQMQSSQQTNRNAGGRNQRGKQIINQQQTHLFSQSAPCGADQSSQAATSLQSNPGNVAQSTGQANAQAQHSSANSVQASKQGSQQPMGGSIQSQAMMLDAPSSQASATGSSMYISQQQRASQGNSIEERKNGMGPPNSSATSDLHAMHAHGGGATYGDSAQMHHKSVLQGSPSGVGNAQSSSMASGGNTAAQMMQSSQSQAQSHQNSTLKSVPQGSSQSPSQQTQNTTGSQMPASQASASASATQPAQQRDSAASAQQQQWLGNSQQNQGSKFNYVIHNPTYQAAQAAVNQQKGVVHTPGQSTQPQQQTKAAGSTNPSPNGVPAPQSQHPMQQVSMSANQQTQMALAGSGTGTGPSGIIPVGVNMTGPKASGSSSAMMQSSGGNARANAGSLQSQEIMNAESGSTAFMNQRSMLYSRQHDQSQAQSQAHKGAYQPTMMPNLAAQSSPSHHVQVSSPPSSSQRGGNGSEQPSASKKQGQQQMHQNMGEAQSMASKQQQEAASVGTGEADYYVAAVGAPPSSRAAAIGGASREAQSSNRQQLGQGVSMAAESTSQNKSGHQAPNSSSGQSSSYLSHQRQSALANNAQKQSPSMMPQATSGLPRFNQAMGGAYAGSGGGGIEQSSVALAAHGGSSSNILAHGQSYLSGSGEQEDQTVPSGSNAQSHQQYQHLHFHHGFHASGASGVKAGRGGSASGTAGGGSAPNESALGNSQSSFAAHMQHHAPQMMGSGGQASSSSAPAPQKPRPSSSQSMTATKQRSSSSVPTNSQSNDSMQQQPATSQHILLQGAQPSSSSGANPSASVGQPNSAGGRDTSGQQQRNMQSSGSSNPSGANTMGQSSMHSQAQQQQHQAQRTDSRKTSGANTPSKDGADTPPYRDQNQMQHISQIYNLTSRKLQVIQNQEERARASSASRERHNNAASNSAGQGNNPDHNQHASFE